MEIETSKLQSIQTGKRKHSEIPELFSNNLIFIIKKVKQQNLKINSYNLTNLEKSFIYIREAIGSDPKQIATSID